mmetsp:Transcript_2031/g.7340  ORF Transcript_2031/g.7340 Transcript_2031/m.7340 type:complete len:253 (+) Transcript_2031:943-1701(+)
MAAAAARLEQAHGGRAYLLEELAVHLLLQATGIPTQLSGKVHDGLVVEEVCRELCYRECSKDVVNEAVSRYVDVPLDVVVVERLDVLAEGCELVRCERESALCLELLHCVAAEVGVRQGGGSRQAVGGGRAEEALQKVAEEVVGGAWEAELLAEGQLVGGDHLAELRSVKHYAERPEVRRRRRRLPLEHLGRNVPLCAADGAQSGGPGLARHQLLAEAEVDDVRAAVGVKDDVGRLDVAVENAVRVQVGQAL